MGTTPQEFCLRWNNHGSNMLNAVDELLQKEVFTDVTLVSEDGTLLKCHKVVLAVCSSYFQRVFMETPCKHPVIVLKDVKYSEIKAIVEYMYHGEVNVAQEQLAGLLKTAEALKVKGLVDENGSGGSREEPDNCASPPPAISTSTSSSAAHSSSHVSPPHSNSSPYNFYGKSSSSTSSPAGERGHGRISMHMWPLSGLSLQQHAISRQHLSMLSGSYNNGFDATALKASKKRYPDNEILRSCLVADSSQQSNSFYHPDNHDSHFRSSSNGSANDNDRRNSTDQSHGEPAHSPYGDNSMMEEDEKKFSPRLYPGDPATTSGIAHYVPTAKPEWKRYKQYSKNDIACAIQAVKGGMSALQASKRYNVPSRTLYDKVKKLGINTERRTGKRPSNGANSGACFPFGIGGNVNGSIYNNSGLSESENENTSAAMDSPASLLENAAFIGTRGGHLDREPQPVADVNRCSPNPTIHSASSAEQQQQQQQQQQSDSENYQVEDLSVNRKSDVRVIVPPPTTIVKQEEEMELSESSSRN